MVSELSPDLLHTFACGGVQDYGATLDVGDTVLTPAMILRGHALHTSEPLPHMSEGVGLFAALYDWECAFKLIRKVREQGGMVGSCATDDQKVRPLLSQCVHELVSLLLGKADRFLHMAILKYCHDFGG